MGKTELSVKPRRTFEECAECYEAFQAEKWLFKIATGEFISLHEWNVSDEAERSLANWMIARKSQCCERIRVIEWLRDLNANGRKES